MKSPERLKKTMSKTKAAIDVSALQEKFLSDAMYAFAPDSVDRKEVATHISKATKEAAQLQKAGVDIPGPDQGMEAATRQWPELGENLEPLTDECFSSEDALDDGDD